MTISFDAMPLVVAGIGLVIWCWPRRRLPKPGILSPEEYERMRKAYDYGTWLRFVLAMMCLVCSVVFAVIGQNQAG